MPLAPITVQLPERIVKYLASDPVLPVGIPEWHVIILVMLLIRRSREGIAQISVQRLARTGCSSAARLLPHLLREALLERVGCYRKGIHGFSYRFIDPGELVDYRFMVGKLIRQRFEPLLARKTPRGLIHRILATQKQLELPVVDQLLLSRNGTPIDQASERSRFVRFAHHFNDRRRHHGRIYTSFQFVPAAYRTFALWRGQPVVHLDVRSSQAFLIGALYSPEAAAEAIRSVDAWQAYSGMSRADSKAHILAALGGGRFHIIDDMRSSGLSAFACALEHWLQVRRRSPAKHRVMMKIEGLVYLTAVRVLYSRRIPAVPIHDCVVVPEAYAQEAGQLFASVVQHITGVMPTLRVSPPRLGEEYELEVVPISVQNAHMDDARLHYEEIRTLVQTGELPTEPRKGGIVASSFVRRVAKTPAMVLA